MSGAERALAILASYTGRRAAARGPDPAPANRARRGARDRADGRTQPGWRTGLASTVVARSRGAPVAGAALGGRLPWWRSPSVSTAHTSDRRPV